MNGGKYNFIILDDSELDCLIAEKIILSTIKDATVRTFTRSEQVLRLINNEEPQSVSYILLDLLMPVISGFELVEEFEKLPKSIQEKYCIIAITSSINTKDLARIKSYHSIQYLLDKPLSSEDLCEIMDASGKQLLS